MQGVVARFDQPRTCHAAPGWERGGDSNPVTCRRDPRGRTCDARAVRGGRAYRHTPTASLTWHQPDRGIEPRRRDRDIPSWTDRPTDGANDTTARAKLSRADFGKNYFLGNARRARGRDFGPHPLWGASREPRGSQRGQPVRERDCIGTGSGRGGNPRLFGRMGWGWWWGARCGVGQLAAAGGAARRGLRAVQDRHGWGERGRAGGLRWPVVGRLAVCERTAGAYFAGVSCVSGLWVAAGCRGSLTSLVGC